MLKLFYVCLFITSGVAVPFFPTYLRGLGLSGRELAFMMSVAPVLHLGVPLGWGWLADRTRRPDLLLRIACAGGGLAILPIIGLRRLSAMAAVYGLYQFFYVPILALADSLALDRMRKMGEDYTRVRLWGSASFLAVCATVGWILEARGRPADPLVPALMGTGLLTAAAAAFGLKGEPGRAAPHFSDLGALLRNRRFLFIVVFAPLHWAALTPYHGFLGILALDRGFPQSLVGTAFFLAVFAEVGAFFAFPRLRRHARLETLLALTAALTSLRWVLTSGLVFPPLGPNPFLILQALHAASFGLFWASSMAWLGDAVPPGLRATGQALFTALTFGVGNLLGFSACGRLYDATGGAQTAFLAAAVLELVPLTMALVARRYGAVGTIPRTN